MPVKAGRVVLTPLGEKPYKVVLEHEPAGTSEYPVDTVREGEALIRERVGLPTVMPILSPEWNI